jgi:hypothetical protein
MSASKPAPNPERLLDGKFGRLLSDANREFAAELDQPAAFRRVTERLSDSRTRRRLTRTFWLVPATLLVLGAFAVIRLKHAGDAPVMIAEDLRGHYPAPKAEESRAHEAAALGQPSTTERTQSKSARAVKRGADAPSSPGSASAIGSSQAQKAQALEPQPAQALEPQPAPLADVATDPPAPAPEPKDAAPAPDCLSLARRGQTRDAEACFLKRAEGSGLGAEMALYEVARLRRDVLADAEGALRALTEYGRRFPSGSLRREADMSQLELLVQLGRSEDALKQSDALLSSSASGERAAELHLLRGHILRKAQSRFAAAAREYELAENAGAHGGEATYFRALCLDSLGRTEEAAALFSQYLEQPQRPYAEDAKRRLKRLNP